MAAIDSSLIQKLSQIQTPEELLKFLYEEFGDRCAIGTSGQLTGSVMIDMAVKSLAASGKKPRVFTVDTQRLFPETYELFDEVDKKYGLKVERLQADPKRVHEMVKAYGENLFFDSKERQELCCQIRKVEPNEDVLETLDVWISGLRVEQSKARAQTQKFEIISHGPQKRPILKVAALVDWSEKQLREYAEREVVPTHKLLNWNQDGWYYESLGCVICTTPIGPDEPRRAGRWRWFNHLDSNKECGIHRVKEDEA